jgi:hypothetical protein
MQASRLIIGVLLLAPVVAAAKSEYAACLEAHLPGTSAKMTVSKRFGIVPTAWYNSYSQYGYSDYRPYVSQSLDSSNASRAADRLSAMARNCRQYRKTTTPSFQVVAIKSPSHSSTINRTRPDAPR